MLKKKLLRELPFLLLALLIVSFIATHAPNVDYDTPSYINFDVTRPLLYPAFLWLFHYQFSLIMWVQCVLLCTVLLHARFWLRRYLQVSDSAIFLVFLMVLITISFHYQVIYIQSEGLTFPLFILTFFLLIECFQKVNYKKIIFLSALVSILVLTRLQFYFFYGIFFILCLWYFWQGLSTKVLFNTFLILFSSMLLTFMTNYSYHYFKHGFFGEAPYSGELLLTQTLYLANNQAANYFQKSELKDTLKALLEQREKQKLNENANLVASFKPGSLKLAYQSYSRNYQAMLSSIEKILSDKYGDRFVQNSMAMEINKVLLVHDIKNNLIFLIWKIIQCTGGINLFLFYWLILLFLMYKIINGRLRVLPLSAIFVGLSALITLLNATIIALFNVDLPIYFCYSQFLFYCLSAFLISKSISLIGKQQLL